MRYFIKLLFILIIIGLTSCKTTPDLDKNELYTILNEIIADDSLHLYIVCSKLEDVSISGDYGFSYRDKQFVARQKELFKDFKLEKNSLKMYSNRKKAFDFIEIDTGCKTGIINRLSFPLISADRKRVLLENTEDCNCMLGGQGSKDLYLKIDGHWKRQKSFDQWISRL